MLSTIVRLSGPADRPSFVTPPRGLAGQPSYVPPSPSDIAVQSPSVPSLNVTAALVMVEVEVGVAETVIAEAANGSHHPPVSLFADYWSASALSSALSHMRI